MLLGRFDLNLTKVPIERALSISRMVQSLVPKLRCIPVSIEALNSQVFVPKQDEKNFRLGESLLQLSEGTHLIVDETNLKEGKLDTTGSKRR